MAEGVEAPQIVVDAAELAREELVEHNGELAPFLVLEEAGLREIRRFDDLGAARRTEAELARSAGTDDRYALVYKGRVGLDDDAIEVELLEAHRTEVEVFFQRFRTRGRFFRGLRFVDELTLAGRREAVG